MPANRPLEGHNILLVDDQRFLRTAIAQGLKAAGARVVEASDGYEGLTVLGLGQRMSSTLEALKRQRPDMFDQPGGQTSEIDCVVGDIRMAPMNGLEMLKSIRCGHTLAPPNLPFVVVSAHSDEPLIGAAIALDASGFSTKPVSQATLVTRILRAIQNPFDAKPGDAYEALIIPEIDMRDLMADVPARGTNDRILKASDVARLHTVEATKVEFSFLQPGHVLAANLTTKSGRTVVPAGTKLTEQLLQALGDLAHVALLADEIEIYSKT